MTIDIFVLRIGIAAVFLTALIGFFHKGKKNWLMTFVQNFCGSFFFVSGFVKAIDPLGTAFKMEDYFSEFYFTFSETAVKFIAPIFPWMSEHSVAFSVAMIVFEMILGLMLVLGAKPKFTAWAFLALVAFFTVLTGFTYFTGHVPSDVNFFEFGKWGPWVETNMKVTDCGCFGDFMKLKPKVTFTKDVLLMVPALYFVFRHKDMHQLFSSKTRSIILWAAGIASLVFCFRNYVWNEPIVDFRPFKAGVNVRAQQVYEMEQSELANKVTAYKMTNKSSGKEVILPMAEYMKEYKNYPKEEWKLEQVKDNPPFETTKISDFDLSNLEGDHVTEEILNYPGYSLMVTAYKMEPEDEGYKKRFSEIINPVVSEAEKAGIKVFAITAGSKDVIEDFRHATQSAYPFYTADDLVIKTIQRSNPGLVLWKDGRIIQKWHFKQLPSFAEIKRQYIR
ncbi:MAG TPA: DoxX family protein [Bacteroidetes bacterium]|nr:DoxX family protein [Bacteroidota bacterium]